jgi:hypothetical protein
MKFKNLYTLLSILFLAYIFMAHSGGRADSQNWGSTGAPGDETLANGTSRTCITCHGGNSFNIDMDINLATLGGSLIADNEYIPGETYNMSVTINSTGSSTPSRYGFQIVALTDSNDEEVNTWANTSSNAKIAFASNTGRTYVEHNNPSADNTFTMEWTAPEVGSGSITLYSCGNGVNGNGGTSGDAAVCTTLTLQEASTSSANSLAPAPFSVDVNPNPAADFINIYIDSPIQEDFTMNILNVNGQLMQSQEWSLNQSDNRNEIQVSELPAGMYFLQMINEKYNRTVRWVKQ